MDPKWDDQESDRTVATDNMRPAHVAPINQERIQQIGKIRKENGGKEIMEINDECGSNNITEQIAHTTCITPPVQGPARASHSRQCQGIGSSLPGNRQCDGMKDEQDSGNQSGRLSNS